MPNTKASGANMMTYFSRPPPNMICAAGEVAPPHEKAIATMPVSRMPENM
jgi:hypothetical protein